MKDIPDLLLEDAIHELSSVNSAHYNERVHWLRSWPSQVILTISMIMWTKQVEEQIGS